MKTFIEGFKSLKFAHKASWVACSVALVLVTFAKFLVLFGLATYTPLSWPYIGLDANFYVVLVLWGLFWLVLAVNRYISTPEWQQESDVPTTLIAHFKSLDAVGTVAFISEIIIWVVFSIDIIRSLTII